MYASAETMTVKRCLANGSRADRQSWDPTKVQRIEAYDAKCFLKLIVRAGLNEATRTPELLSRVLCMDYEIRRDPDTVD